MEAEDSSASVTHDFKNKRQLLFESLTAAEVCVKGTILEQNDSSSQTALDQLNRNNVNNKIVHKYSGRESIFKRPDAPISQRLRSKLLQSRPEPDYELNPHKWKKYSLDDVDISDYTNTSAAFAFLKEIEERKQNEINSSNDSSVSVKEKQMKTKEHVLFNRSNRLKNQLDNLKKESMSPDNKSMLKGSKVLMPEYVIGEKSKNIKKNKLTCKNNKQSTTSSKNSLKLDHLFEADGDGDDE